MLGLCDAMEPCGHVTRGGARLPACLAACMHASHAKVTCPRLRVVPVAHGEHPKCDAAVVQVRVGHCAPLVSRAPRRVARCHPLLLFPRHQTGAALANVAPWRMHRLPRGR